MSASDPGLAHQAGGFARVGLRLARGGHDPEPVGGQRQRDRAADVQRAAGHQRDLVFVRHCRASRLSQARDWTAKAGWCAMAPSFDPMAIQWRKPWHTPPSASRDAVRATVPKMIELTEKVLFGDVWERPNLSKRDRSLIVCATLIATYRPEQLRRPSAARAGQRRDQG